MPSSSPILLFDGECNLCHAAVAFIIKRDKRARFIFASLQSVTGKALTRNHGLPESELSSIVLISGGRLFTYSTAALKACGFLDGAWPLLVGFILVPRLIRDPVYRWIAKNRYKWFGKRDACLVPSATLASRFLP